MVVPALHRLNLICARQGSSPRRLIPRTHPVTTTIDECSGAWDGKMTLRRALLRGGRVPGKWRRRRRGIYHTDGPESARSFDRPILPRSDREGAEGGRRGA